MSGAEERLNEQLNPFLGSTPAEETGPGASFAPTTTNDSKTPASTSTRPLTPPRDSSPRTSLSSNNPFRNVVLNSPSPHGSPKQISSTTRELRPYGSPSSPRRSIDHSGRQELYSSVGSGNTRPRRSSSLRERYPGDTSVRPLDQLAREKAVADRARHVTKKHAIHPDTIDVLDSAGVGHYHHEGPYDATLLARNNSYLSSPVAATASTTEETLKATPHEKIVDSVRGHRPLEGVALYPPGTTDREGRTYNYQEGENMMIDLNPGGGAYKRWPGIDYHPDDIKGKGEPSYSIEKALKEHSLEDRNGKNGEEGIEMQSRSRTGSDVRGNGMGTAYAQFRDPGELARRESIGGKLKKRIGSLRKSGSGRSHDAD